MKKRFKKSILSSLALFTLFVSATPVFATDLQDNVDTAVTETSSCNSECVPIYGPWCHGYRLIIGYKNVCTLHNH